MLSTKQIETINACVKTQALLKDVAHEMVDHYATNIEILMIDGHSFESALKQTSAEFNTSEILEINRQYKKNRFMKQLIKNSPFIGTFTVIAIMLSTQLLSQEEKWQPPFNNTVENRITSEYGYRTHPIEKTKKLHTGIDFAAPMGSPVNAVKSGVIDTIEHNNSGYGNKVVINHYDGTQSVYAQLSEILVNKNDSVKGGQLIAKVGSSGTSTGPHLHFELIREGKKVNPSSVDKIFTKSD